ncbi:MAG: hypothetical protein AUH31_00075 [Armatimonadetes bacterium 13_1_40CM_64_14]|nr:MAG: hypothetical protein AUH31_00075 [Armatimonadetes bacterium 13_1_40CM_64_14]
MRLIADLHLHSKYSRATSREMDVENMARWCKIKGISIVGTGDFTHPVWLRELKAKLKPTDRGLYTHAGVHFMLTVEVSNVGPQGGDLRRFPLEDILSYVGHRYAAMRRLSTNYPP